MAYTTLHNAALHAPSPAPCWPIERRGLNLGKQTSSTQRSLSSRVIGASQHGALSERSPLTAARRSTVARAIPDSSCRGGSSSNDSGSNGCCSSSHPGSCSNPRAAHGAADAAAAQSHSEPARGSAAAAAGPTTAASSSAADAAATAAAEAAAGTASGPSPHCRPLDVSRRLARARLHESRQQQPLFMDPYAQQLVSTGQQDEAASSDWGHLQRTTDVITTKYLDETVMNALAVTNTNRISSGDYRQVVLVGDGMDTRPFRLLWPEGTVLFLVAPAEAHELAEAVMSQQGARVRRGCLMRRVNGDPLQAPGHVIAELQRAGFRSDRLSVWVVQGLTGRGGVGVEQLQGLLTDISSLAAFNSLVMGELPAMSRAAAENLLAEFGLLGAVVEHGTDSTSYGRWECSRSEMLQAGAAADPHASPAPQQRQEQQDQQPRPWLFAAQHMRLSLAQMGVYEAHVSEAEGTDEDFLTHFS